MPGKFTFYTSTIQDKNALFDENETRHAIGTLRFKVGDQIEFTNGLGDYYYGTIKNIEKRLFSAQIHKSEIHPRKGLLTIACGIIKSTDRMEWMVEKCTEMGISSIVFFDGQKSERNKLNLERMQKIAIGALKQSHGAWLPNIELLKWKDILKLEIKNKWIAKVEVGVESLPLTFSNPAEAHLLLIGPEGDFSETEFNDCIGLNFKPVMMGKNVLRTETAVIAAAASFYLSQN